MIFSDKKIAVLGLGIEGEDVCRFLQKNGATKVTIFDQKNTEELGQAYKNFQSARQLAGGRTIFTFQLGQGYLKDGLTEFDIIFRSPAFKLSLPEIMAARRTGVEISSATKLFFDLCPGKIIGVTGTKGKGTTATLIYQILKKAGKRAFLAGNIGGPMLALLPKLSKDSWIVLELSSFQLQDIEKSPHIAVVLFITSEHLDYHKNTEEYIEAKSNIVRHQKKSDFAILNGDNQVSASFAKLTLSQVFGFSREKKVNGGYIINDKIFVFDKEIGPAGQLQIRGAHNWDNVCAAITVSWLVGASIETIRKAVFSFKGLEHRLEFVRKLNGIDFYNDSFSTTPETTIAAIKSFATPIILIAGGSEKGSDYTQLGKEITQSSVKSLILIGEMAKKIKKAVQAEGFQGRIIYKPGGIKEIVTRAFTEAGKGDVILLSPGCASFDMFENYKDRGSQFKQYAQALKGHP